MGSALGRPMMAATLGDEAGLDDGMTRLGLTMGGRAGRWEDNGTLDAGMAMMAAAL